MNELFPTDAMLPAAAPRDLPTPDERRRLRRQSDLSLHQVADACSVTETTVRDWENGTTTPRGHNADVYRNLLAGLHARLTQTPAPAYPDTTAPDWPALGAIHREIPSQAGTDQPCRRCRQPTGQRVGGKPQHLGTRCPAPASPPAPSAAPQRVAPASIQPAAVFPTAVPAARLDYPTAGRRTSEGPLAVIDTDGGQGLAARYPDGHRRPVAADNCTELLSWAVTAGLGTPAVKPGAGLDTGPLLVLTEAATAHLALPLTPPAWAQRHPRSDHPLLQQLRAIGWQTDTHGLGPWSTLHPSNQDPHRDGIHLAVTAWGALYRDAW
ncbi:helix-turn-helix domain-containing protein, partial [Streptomyces umbrinus]|uniref:helix-turn-helix domain-containing protein n=1 Tax=Streptomyces umbrinus TaxID=67370 RepID=UPI003C2FC055